MSFPWRSSMTCRFMVSRPHGIRDSVKLSAILVLLSSLLLSSQLPAQSVSAASGATETVLAGIDIRHTGIAEIEKIYGPHDAMYAPEHSLETQAYAPDLARMQR